MKDLAELCERAGYHFQNEKLLVTALTHTSYANEHRRQGCHHNERMEFLGDAVLELVSSEFLYNKYSKMEEGDLSKVRAGMVCEPSLAKCARDIGLPEFLRRGKGEEQMGGRQKDSIISDALEAFIGAIFLDGGFEEARSFVRAHILLDLSEEDLFSDKKTVLQELLQAKGLSASYELIDESGPAHDKRFRIAVAAGGDVLGEGEGKTKKAAAQAAAEEALRAMNAL